MSNKEFFGGVLKNKKVLYGGGGSALVVIVLLASLFGGDLFKGFLLQPLKAPDYEKCVIKQGEKLTEINCPELKPEELEVGSYELLVNYGDKNLGNAGKSVVPIRVLNFSGVKDYVCEYQAQGYVGELYLSDVSGQREVKIENGEIVNIGPGEKKKLRVAMVKDGVRYPYDTNVCGSGIVGRMSKNGVALGTVAYGINGFLNQAGIDSFIVDANQVYYRMEGNTMKLDEPGQYVLKFDEMGSGGLGFSMECGKMDLNVKIEDLEVNAGAQSLLIPVSGLNEDFVKSCADSLYLSVRLGNDDVNARIVSMKVSKVGENVVLLPNFYEFRNIFEAEAQKMGYPLSYGVKLHGKDSGGAVKTFAEFVITVLGENVQNSESAVAPIFSGSAPEMELKKVEVIEDEKVVEEMILNNGMRPTGASFVESEVQNDQSATVTNVEPIDKNEEEKPSNDEQNVVIEEKNNAAPTEDVVAPSPVLKVKRLQFSN